MYAGFNHEDVAAAIVKQSRETRYYFDTFRVFKSIRIIRRFNFKKALKAWDAF